MNIIRKKKKKNSIKQPYRDQTQLLALGKLLMNQQHLLPKMDFRDYGFKIFSQFDDDGLIQYLIKNIRIDNKIFIEFGVEDYEESNTRFLMMNNNWQGLVMDGSNDNIMKIRKAGYFWRYDLMAKSVFITRENINVLLEEYGAQDIGLLSIDLDGNDAHILEAIDMKTLNPSIIIVEYNSIFGKERAISVPYDKSFIRREKHYSGLYYGASLRALSHMAKEKGYALIGCNSFGNNAYFVRNDLINESVMEKSVEEAFVTSHFRESRDISGKLTFLGGSRRIECIKGLKVINMINGEEELI